MLLLTSPTALMACQTSEILSTIPTPSKNGQSGTPHPRSLDARPRLISARRTSYGTISASPPQRHALSTLRIWPSHETIQRATSWRLSNHRLHRCLPSYSGHTLLRTHSSPLQSLCPHVHRCSSNTKQVLDPISTSRRSRMLRHGNHQCTTQIRGRIPILP